MNTTIREPQRPEGYEPHFNDIDAEICADSMCDKCGTKGLRYYGFKRTGSYVAFAVCPRCGDMQEF